MAPCWSKSSRAKEQGASVRGRVSLYCTLCVSVLVCRRPPSHLSRSSLLHFLFMPRDTSTDTPPTIYLLCWQPNTKPLPFSRNTFAAKCATLHTPPASASTATHRSASSPCLQRPTLEVELLLRAHCGSRRSLTAKLLVPLYFLKIFRTFSDHSRKNQPRA